MTATQLRNSILQEAFAGNLVPQNLSVGNANEILSAIHKEKLRFVKEGMIKKKELVDIPIGEHEIPYEIPSHWMWVRLRSVVYNHGQKTPTNKFSYIDIGSIDNKHQRLNLNENIIEAKNAPSRARKIVTAGDIIYSTVRPYLHNMAIIDREFTEEPIASTGFSVFTCHQGLFNKFLFYYLLSPAFDSYVNDGDNARGVAYPAINDDKLYKAIIPFPPLAEQKRIVAKLEELLPIVEQYGKAQKELDELNAALPARLRQSILQEAISGRLVPQDENEGTAEELLKRIDAEKQRLKLKTSKKFESLTIEDEPFDIPKTWRWCLLGDLAAEDMGKTPPRGESIYWEKAIYPWVSIADMKDYGHIKTTKEAVSEHAAQKAFRNISPIGSLLMSFKLTVGRTSILDIEAYHNEAIITIKPYVDENYAFRNYLFYILPLIANMGDSKDAIKGKTLNSTSLYALPIPLPPLAEQQRIVAKIEELFAEIDKLK